MSSTPEMIRRTHVWFASNSGWSPPDDATMAEWMSDGVCRCPDDCLVAPASPCTHGLASWWLVVRTLDRPDGEHPLPPVLVTPHPDRLDPERHDYVAAMDAHHRALLAGEAGYLDPTSGLFVLTVRTLWDQGACCGKGCRHCPYVDR